MRIATFNLESLDLPPKAHVPLEVRAQVLRPALARLEADVLCLQEVNGQPVGATSFLLERRMLTTTASRLGVQMGTASPMSIIW